MWLWMGWGPVRGGDLDDHLCVVDHFTHETFNDEIFFRDIQLMFF